MAPIRAVVWSTDGVGSVAVDAVRNRPDLELVGVWVHSPDKVGKDAGELAGGEPVGLAATNDADALIALKPDCVVYAASGPQRDAGAVPDYLKLLSAGRRHLPHRHRRRPRHPLRNDDGRGAGARRGARGDGRDGDAGRERRSLRGGSAGRAAQFARYPDDVAAARIRLRPLVRRRQRGSRCEREVQIAEPTQDVGRLEGVAPPVGRSVLGFADRDV